MSATIVNGFGAIVSDDRQRWLTLSSRSSPLLSTVNDVELVGIAEIREMLGGISRQRAHVIASSKGFPDPIAELTMGKVWRKDDVLKWIRENRPELLQ